MINKMAMLADLIDQNRKKLAIFIGLVLAIFHLYTSATFPLTPMLQRSIHLGLGFPLVFLLYPLSKGKEKKAWYTYVDLFWAAAGFAGAFYIAVNVDTVTSAARLANPLPIDMIMGIITIVALMEGVRRVCGLPLVIIAVVALLYVFAGKYLPEPFFHPGVKLKNFIGMSYLYTEGIFSQPLGVSASIVFVFILFGRVLEALGGSEYFMRTANSLVGSFRGGPAKVAVIASGLFGSISGSSTANVAGTGSVTIPLMKRVGYSAEFAGAVEATASSGGMIMPPIMGSGAFLMAELLGVSYGTIIKAAIIPAILYFTSVFITVDLRAGRRNLKGLSKEQCGKFFDIIRQKGYVYFPPLILLVVLVAVLEYSAPRAAFFSTVALFAVALLDKDTRQKLKNIIEILGSAAKGALPVMMATSIAGLVIAMLGTTGLGLKFAEVLTELAGNNAYLMLIASAFTCLVLGMGVPAAAVYVMTSMLIGPSIVSVGIVPIAAHMFLFYMGEYAALSPPVCVTAYVAAGISGGHALKTGMTAIRIALPSFLIAFIFAIDPKLLGIGSAFEIITATVFALVGIFSAAAASEGYLINWQIVNPVLRIVLLAAALLMIIPEIITSIIGIALLIGIIAFTKPKGSLDAVKA